MRVVASRQRRVLDIAQLFGTTSLFALASTALQAAAPPAAAPPPVEEVLITGSLIAGTAAVGVPITAVGDEDFRETGAMTIVDALRAIPSLSVGQDVNASQGAGRLQTGGQSVDIHGFGTGSTLLMVNGVRFPIQGQNRATDPSIIPQIAVQRVDILTAGASAVYGSDAVAGVINVILKRNYDGAITFVRYNIATDLYKYPQWTFAQLYGRTWDGGGITLSYEFYDQRKIPASELEQFTMNFEPWGLDDRSPLASTMPGIVSTGAPSNPPGGIPTGFTASTGTRFCNNCYSLPHGIGWDFGDQDPGPTTSWSAILPNKFVIGQTNLQNQRQNWEDATATPHQQRNAVVMTLDQRLLDDAWGLGPVELFVDAFYSNRRGVLFYPAPWGVRAENLHTPVAGLTVPTHNPYYPTGAPAGLRAHYTLAIEAPTRVLAGEIAQRYSFGLNFDELPFGWHGKVFYSMTEDKDISHNTNTANRNAVDAAMGHTIASVPAAGTIPGKAAFTKPANIPFLNMFCDATVYQCNSPQTIAYVMGAILDNGTWKIQETGGQIDGPLFDLPAGPVQVAIAGQTLSHHTSFTSINSFSSFSTADRNITSEFQKQQSWSVFGQINIPLVSEMNALPFVEVLEIEAGYRYDHYDLFDGVKTPKLAGNWSPGFGFNFRAAYGKSFRAPPFAELSTVANIQNQGLNQLGGANTNTIVLDCAVVEGFSGSAGTALPGSLTAALNPTCSPNAALRNPGGILLRGPAGAAVAVRGGIELSPEKSRQWSLGLNYTPDYIPGLSIDGTYFDVRVDDRIAGNNPGTGPNDPNSAGRWAAIIPNPLLPITDPSNAEFLQLVRNILATGNIVFDPNLVPNVKFVQDNATTNAGWLTRNGFDLQFRYDWDMGNWGAWHVGAAGSYFLGQKTQANEFSAIIDAYEGRNSGAHLQRARYQLGWSNGDWTVTGFVNHEPHSSFATEIIPPDCFYKPGFTAGSCYPGSEHFGPFPNDIYPNMGMGLYTADLAIGYNTGDTPTMPYLSNIFLQFSATDILDVAAPFAYRSRGRGRDMTAHDNRISYLGRRITISITKNW